MPSIAPEATAAPVGTPSRCRKRMLERDAPGRARDGQVEELGRRLQHDARTAAAAASRPRPRSATAPAGCSVSWARSSATATQTRSESRSSCAIVPKPIFASFVISRYAARAISAVKRKSRGRTRRTGDELGQLRVRRLGGRLAELLDRDVVAAGEVARVRRQRGALHVRQRARDRRRRRPRRTRRASARSGPTSTVQATSSSATSMSSAVCGAPSVAATRLDEHRLRRRRPRRSGG